MPMVNNEVCSRLKDGAGDSRVCAGGKRGEGVCDKDNGGPLVCEERHRKIIIGVSIQRTKCASSQPALFVNVAFYSAWIYKVFRLYPVWMDNKTAGSCEPRGTDMMEDQGLECGPLTKLSAM
ncbi:hypothetical protein CRUP_026282 [Coryphaenoides rupestris]|nr:hypothetical protein CRUP_026282 [Coryphaenoides rupestris]